MTQNSGLGRGLGSLINNKTNASPRDIFFNPNTGLDTLTESQGGYFAEIEISMIRPNPKQPRKKFTDSELQELSESIKLVGVLQPIRVQQKTENGKAFFQLIMGERRCRASKLAGKDTIPALVQFTEDDELLRHALFENIHRVNLNPLEEALAYKQMMEDFDYSQAELSQTVAKGRSTIANILRLLKLPDSVLLKIENGTITKGHANALLALEDKAEIEKLADLIEKNSLSVRQTEQIVYTPKVVTGVNKGKAKAKSKSSPLIDELKDKLEDYFNTAVSINVGARKKGSIIIDFASQEDMDRIIELISPDISSSFN